MREGCVENLCREITRLVFHTEQMRRTWHLLNTAERNRFEGLEEMPGHERIHI